MTKLRLGIGVNFSHNTQEKAKIFIDIKTRKSFCDYKPDSLNNMRQSVSFNSFHLYYNSLSCSCRYDDSNKPSTLPQDYFLTAKIFLQLLCCLCSRWFSKYTENVKYVYNIILYHGVQPKICKKSKKTVTRRRHLLPKTSEISFREINYLFNRKQCTMLNYQFTSRIQQEYFFSYSLPRTQQNGWILQYRIVILTPPINHLPTAMQ